MLLYALTILVSAFLLFQVEPVIAKIILPWFGGSSAVWTTCLLFFQLVLLLGYLYSHAVIRYLKPRVQMAVHIGLLVVSALALPIYPNAYWKPADPGQPALRILALLAVTVGMPFFLLSSTGPLLQAWYARRHKNAMPYRLYALSNAGSMFALLSYPVLFEPVFATHEQAVLWSIAYGCFALLCAFVAFRSGTAPAVELERESGVEEKPGPRLYLLWLLLPACASALLLAITNHLSQNVAAIPFLWVLPLAVYLLSFILCFESAGWYHRFAYMPLLAIALGLMVYFMFADKDPSGTHYQMLGLTIPGIAVSGLLFLFGLFTCCMVCHGELARLKPHPRYLTHFYLMMSAGGALGGVFVALVAPLAFSTYLEMPICVVLCGALAVIVLRNYPDPAWLGRLLPVWRFIATCAVVAVAGCFVFANSAWITTPAHTVAHVFAKDWDPPELFDQWALGVALVVGSALALAICRGDWRLRWARSGSQWGAFAIELFAVVLAGYVGYQTLEASSGNRLIVRNFYGGLKVRDSGPYTDLDATRGLTHGTINHGEQFLNPARIDKPTTYYGTDTGVGLAVRSKQEAGPIRLGVIGLGTGTMAAYGRTGDYIRFYEINPLVYRMSVPADADVAPQFTFVRRSKATVDVAMGDARLSLEREAPENFDVLVVDAFSSDSIPVHLLTKEAMALYFHHLKPDGILAVHISNRYLDLEPVVLGESRALGKIARTVDTDDITEDDVFSATWVLVTPPQPGFRELVEDSSEPAKATRKVRLWTDDYSNLFQILK